MLDDEHAVVDRGRRLVFTGDLVHRRLRKELVDELGDTLVERGREEQLLAAIGGLAQDALNRLEEAQVTHVVGLVEHRDGDFAEVETALLDQVFDSSGRADDDVDAALECADLAALRNTAVDLRGEEADAAGDRLHGAVDLQGELTGRSEDERTGLATHLALLAAAVLHELLDERRTEGDGLAGARAATSEHVLAGDDIRDGRGLDRER